MKIHTLSLFVILNNMLYASYDLMDFKDNSCISSETHKKIHIHGFNSTNNQFIA